MSLIVHVNSGAAVSSSSVVASASAQPTTVVVASTAPEAPVTIQSSLATLVAAAEQQQKQQQQQQKLQQHVQRGEPLGGVPTITRITTNINPHIVQHHPPPLRMVQLSAANATQLTNGPTVVTLPQAPAPLPLRHVLPQSPVGRPQPQLPRSPIRQHQLPTTPLQRSVVQQQQQQQQHVRGQPHLRNTAVTVINGGQQCITVNPAGRNNTHLSMLPQAPTPGLLPSAASLQGLLPQSPAATLVPLPAHHRIQPTNLVTANSTAILPPTYLNRQLFSRSGLTPDAANMDGHLRSRLEMAVDPQPPHQPQTRRNAHHPGGNSSRQQQARDRRSLPCQLALQDHNYVSRPPPTPSPPPLPPPVLQLTDDQRKRLPPSQGLPMHPNPASSFSPDLRGLVPEPRVSALSPLNSRFNPLQSQQQQQQQQQQFAATHSPDGLVAAVTGPPGSNQTAGEPIGMSVLPPRVQANLSSIEEAGVGPMAPLVEDDNSHLSNNSSTGDDQERGGEETETAPEGEPEDDSITRCICDFLHDDGYMICCDKCLVWQHVVCMGLDKNNIPDEYLCEVCKPRPIDRKRAKTLQSRRRTEIFNNSSSSDDDKKLKKRPTGHHPLSSSGSSALANNKKILDRKAAFGKKPPSLPLSKLKKAGTSLLDKAKKAYRKRSGSGSQQLSNHLSSVAKKVSPKKSAIARRKSQTLNDSDLDSDVENFDDLEPMVDASQNVRSWIDQYEEAVTNHYSPELRARLASGRLNNIGGDLRPSAISGPTRCNVSLKGNGVKILTACSNLTTNTPVIECKGKLMLASQFRATNKVKGGPTPPFVFFYSLGDVLEICLDGKTYGNDGRFCRRSAAYNAELRHVIDKGSLHLFIVAIKGIEKNQEILLPPDASADSSSPLPSINADLKEIKKPMNGLLSLSSPEEAPLAVAKKKEKKKVKVMLKTKGPDNKKAPLPRKLSTSTKVKTEIKAETKPNVNGKIKEEEAMVDPDEEEGGVDLEEEKQDEKAPPSPVKNGPVKSSPSKLGLPDNSGLIVGVNTINYDASSSLKNKAKSREERKMEMIMKAIEAMEKAEQRKKEGTDGVQDKPPTKRRRSSSSYRNNDSNLDASSADESKPEPKRSKKKGRSKTGGPGTPQRRRSRVMSGGSASNMSADETIAGNDSSILPATHSGPFRLPKTKKSLMSDWLQESESNTANEDDDVSANYLKGSRSPPGIASHLLRSNAHSPIKSVCSAKKRWLRQAISEDHSDEVMVNGSASPSSEAALDMVTPLKKRRLANYKEDQEQENEDMDSSCSPVPNGLKKQILQNIVLEAVLDKAMEDMQANMDAPLPKEEVKPVVTSACTSSLAKRQGQEEFSASPEAAAVKKEEEDVEAEEDQQQPEEVVPKQEPNVSESSPTVKAPEVNSAFKSFFNSNVSLEALEAEIAATRKQRESPVVNVNPSEELANSSSPLAAEVPEFEEVKSSEVETSSSAKNDAFASKEDEDEEDEIAERCQVKNDDHSPMNDTHEVAKPEPVIMSTKEEEQQVQPELAEAKPKTKKRVSLADYKSLRRVSTSSTPATPTIDPPASFHTPSSLSLPPLLPPCSSTSDHQRRVQDDPGTPTQDEAPVASSLVMPTSTLNALPLFEKLDKLEQAQQELKKKGTPSVFGFDSSASSISAATIVRSPIVEPKREDLTSRLQKEFGLLVDNDPNEDDDLNNEMDGGDATPEEDSPPPPPPSSGSASSRFLPSQIPSYPQSYSSSSLPQPSSFNSRSSSSVVAAAISKYPPAPSLTGPMAYQGGLNFPPPPPPVNYCSSKLQDEAPQPIPPPPPAPLPALKGNNLGPSSMNNSSRRPPSKDYYNRGSPGGGNRGYYNSHRDRRDHSREKDRKHSESRSRADDRSRDRDHRDRDYRSQSSSRRNYQSRSYY